jgi:hypothetical protein
MFFSGYNAVLVSLDTELHNEDGVMAALDYLVPQSVQPGKYLPMAKTPASPLLSRPKPKTTLPGSTSPEEVTSL